MLKDREIAAAKPGKHSDGGGLLLVVTEKGARYWRLKYRILGKEKLLALGVYPEVRSPEARMKAEAARKLIREGIDPSVERKATKQAKLIAATNTFKLVALEWLEVRKSSVEPEQHTKTLARLESDVFPWLGDRPIGEINAPEILAVLRRIDGRGARYTAHRVRSEISRVFRFAIQGGRVATDPAHSLIGAIPPVKTRHMPSITEPAKVGEMLRAFEAFSGTFPVLCALKLAPMLFVRPGELRKAEWADIDLDKAEWRYLVTKTDTNHLVPLARQAVAILRELHALTGAERYVFPGGRTATRPMSDAAINAALRRMGFDTKTEITGHGFRAMARTILHEELHQQPEVIEHQLAHSVPDALGVAYNRTKFLKARKAMMQVWADYLDQIKTGAEVVAVDFGKARKAVA